MIHLNSNRVPILVFVLLISISCLHAQVRVYYNSDSICVESSDSKTVCYNSDYWKYGEYLDKDPLYLLNETINQLYIYNPRDELIQVDISKFQTKKRISIAGPHKNYDASLEFIDNYVFFKSSAKILLFDENLCITANYHDSLVNSTPSIEELLVKSLEYHTSQDQIVFTVTSYPIRYPELNSDSTIMRQYTFKCK